MEFEEWIETLTEQDKLQFLREFWDGFYCGTAGDAIEMAKQRESDGGGHD
jgi:hypothetical protein